jgi:signal transduction histidine kinase
VRLYDATGAQRRALPDLAQPESLEAATLARMRAGEKDWKFFPKTDPERALGLPAHALNMAPAPLLEITVPLQRPKKDELLGAARYWIDGADVLEEFRKIDHQLLLVSGLAFVCGALLLTAVLAWAFEQLNRTNRALQRRSEDLVRANRELAFVAKTSALGAISAHLIHDLKNPLAGLEGFVRDEAASPEKTGDGDAWREAVDTARRLRTTVTDITALLRDEADGAFVSLSPAEIAGAAIRRSAEAAARTGVTVVPELVDGHASVSGREANLAVLVLANLLDNACKASKNGAEVRLTVRAGNQGLEFLVTDRGSGLPDAVRKELFQPKTSSRAGGGGLGLAISQQLARHAGGKIELVHSGPEGTQFCLLLPL